MKEEIDPTTGEKWIELNKDEIEYGFLSQCIEAAAEADKCDYLKMFNRLEAADMTQGYILKHYPTLHTESWENIINDILATLKIRETKQSISNV